MAYVMTLFLKPPIASHSLDCLFAFVYIDSQERCTAKGTVWALESILYVFSIFFHCEMTM